MSDEKKRIAIIGDGETAELAYEYLTHDSPRQVVAFCVESAYKHKDEMFGLPVVTFEEVERRYSPAEYSGFRRHLIHKAQPRQGAPLQGDQAEGILVRFYSQLQSIRLAQRDSCLNISLSCHRTFSEGPCHPAGL